MSLEKTCVHECYASKKDLLRKSPWQLTGKLVQFHHFQKFFLGIRFIQGNVPCMFLY